MECFLLTKTLLVLHYLQIRVEIPASGSSMAENGRSDWGSWGHIAGFRKETLERLSRYDAKLMNDPVLLRVSIIGDVFVAQLIMHVPPQ